MLAWNRLIRLARCSVAMMVPFWSGVSMRAGPIAVTFRVVFGECPDEAGAGLAAAAFDDPDECVADVAEVDPLAAAVFPGVGAEVELLVQRPQLLERPCGSGGTGGTGSPNGSLNSPAGSTVQPSSWTRRWWRRQSRIRFASSVGPPSAQCSRWCACSPRVFVQPGKRQQPSGASESLCTRLVVSCESVSEVGVEGGEAFVPAGHGAFPGRLVVSDREVDELTS